MGKDLVINSGGLEVVNEMLQLCRGGGRQVLESQLQPDESLACRL